MTLEAAEAGSDIVCPNGPITWALAATVAPRLNVSFHQNAIPSVSELTLVAGGDAADIAIQIEATPPFLRPATLHLDTVAGGATRRISPVPVELDLVTLRSLKEAVKAEITFVARRGEEELARLAAPVTLLAPNEWTGLAAAPELIAAFVRPNDPAIDATLRKAAEKLSQAGEETALDGYKSGKRHRALKVAAAIWAAMLDQRIVYALPPQSFESDGQKVRSPSEIVTRKIATCLDTTLYYAACLEQAGLYPLVGFLEGHAFCGVWLVDDSFASVQVDEAQVLRKRLAANDIALIETTLLTASVPIRFSDARAKAAEFVSETPERRFECVIDIRRARQQGVRPLAFGDETPADAAKVAVGAVSHALEEIEAVEEDIVLVETGPEPADRLERWKRKLLDLSLRNKLLNFKPGKGAVTLIAPDPAGVEDRLASDRQLKILPSPALFGASDPRDAELRLRTVGDDAARKHAIDGLARDEVHAPLLEDDLNDRLLDLFRAARLAQEEGGANALHLAIGFVAWTPNDGKSARYKAPLLLVPVKLERRTVRSGFRLALHDDDARINPTLLEMLRQDFKLSMPELERDLPTDANGLDVARIWRITRAHLQEMKGFELTEEVVLSTFSFAKYLMWKDLVDRTELLKRNPVVRHLIDTPKETYPGSERPLPDERRLDAEISPADLFMPLHADSSQTAAVVAASRGRDFVLFGPPGTGKSQTIANMIVQLLGAGKTVLFVSQKTTALDVVRRRLDAVGVGDWCLEVHSAKAQKSEVLGQLRKAWDRQTEALDSDWAEATRGLGRLRDELNALVGALHRRRANGLTAHQAMAKVIALRDVVPGLRLDFGDAQAHDRAALEGLRAALAELLVALRAVGPLAEHPLAGVGQRQWSPRWRDEFLAAAQAFPAAARDYQRTLTDAAATTGVAPPRAPDVAPAWLQLLSLALKPEASDAVRLLSQDSAAARAAFAEWRRHVATCEAIYSRLSGPYRDEVFAEPLADILREFREAKDAFMLFRNSRRQAAEARLAKVAASATPIDVEKDVPALLELAAASRSADAYEGALSTLGPRWRGPQTDPATIETLFQWEDAARSAASSLAGAGWAEERPLDLLRRIVERKAAGGDQGGATHQALLAFLRAYKALVAARSRLAEAAATTVDLGLNDSDDWLAAAIERAQRWAGAERLTPKWCACQQALDAARAAGLSELVDRIVTGEIATNAAADALQVGYARWWIDAIVDAEPALRGFVSERHEETIVRFRKADERVARLSRAVVARRLGERIPPRTAFGSDIEFGLLNHEISKKKRHLPLRQLFSRMPNALQKIAPCMMMSPLSIAQFLPAEAKPYDVVIFDEASQIPVWDAVGAIARGAQVIVAGDPKQLPPTSFFDRSADDDGDADDIEDLESILDECLGASVPFKCLAWHYRSRRESLIAFSNERYYDGQLVTFPAPETQDRAVRYVHVPDGVYERGGGRVNRAEAQAVVDEVTRRLLAAGARESLGVVTFNSEQQRLIENLLDQARRSHPAIEPFFAAQHREPVFIKNLESVQGDERDVILFSVGYGPDASGRVAQNFGPLNRDGGPRRLNVAITRARSELLIFATLRPEQIDLSRSRAAGVRDFKHFLEFAERGAQALAQAAAPLDRDEDSDFEREVRAGLEAKGWSVHPQVGVSGLRIDLGVVHPQAPGRYLAGVECDGATYHRSATARDRDRLRQAALESLGWRILRVWSTDWWMDREGALARIDGQLQAALTEEERLAQERLAKERLEVERRAAEAAAEAETSAAADEGEAAEPADSAGPVANDASDQPVSVPESEPATRQLYAEAAAPPAPARDERQLDPIGGTPYTLTDLAAEGCAADRECFYETAYRPALRRMAVLVIEREGPIFEDCLVARITAAHGFARAAGKIRATIVDTVERRFPRSIERDGDDERKIYWPENADRTALPPFRPAPRDVRDHSDIPLIELASLAASMLTDGASDEEALRRMAELFDLGRLRASTRARFEEAVRLAQEQSDQTLLF